jgi:hypothetical protein
MNRVPIAAIITLPRGAWSSRCGARWVAHALSTIARGGIAAGVTALRPPRRGEAKMQRIVLVLAMLALLTALGPTPATAIGQCPGRQCADGICKYSQCKCYRVGTHTICAWMNIDYTNHRVRAYGSVHDPTFTALEIDKVRLRQGPNTVEESTGKGGILDITQYTYTHPCGGGHRFASWITVPESGTLLTFKSGVAETKC